MKTFKQLIETLEDKKQLWVIFKYEPVYSLEIKNMLKSLIKNTKIEFSSGKLGGSRYAIVFTADENDFDFKKLKTILDSFRDVNIDVQDKLM